jgi:hypothetical protein
MVRFPLSQSVGGGNMCRPAAVLQLLVQDACEALA